MTKRRLAIQHRFTSTFGMKKKSSIQKKMRTDGDDPSFHCKKNPKEMGPLESDEDSPFALTPKVIPSLRCLWLHNKALKTLSAAFLKTMSRFNCAICLHSSPSSPPVAPPLSLRYSSLLPSCINKRDLETKGKRLIEWWRYVSTREGNSWEWWESTTTKQTTWHRPW